LTSRDWFCYS